MFRLPTRFLKAQLASLTASMTDFSITFVLTAFAGWWYGISAVIGVACGGILNFSMSRHWVFHASEQKRRKQILRYILVWSSSMLLNVGGTIMFTELLPMHYMVSKVITSVLVGVLFNYQCQKFFVFKV